MEYIIGSICIGILTGLITGAVAMHTFKAYYKKDIARVFSCLNSNYDQLDRRIKELETDNLIKTDKFKKIDSIYLDKKYEYANIRAKVERSAAPFVGSGYLVKKYDDHFDVYKRLEK